MTPLSELTDKDLAIKLAGKIGDKIHYVDSKLISVVNSNAISINKYFESRAGKILFSESKNIQKHLVAEYTNEYKEHRKSVVDDYLVDWYWDINPRKIIEVYLSMERG